MSDAPPCADPAAAFAEEVKRNIASLAADADLHRLSTEWIRRIAPHGYPYNFTWLGRPIIQLPQDIVATQEIIWRTQPDLVIETGIAHGGSLVLHASILELLGRGGLVLGIDIDIRRHNRRAIEAHPLADRIRMIEGSSIDAEVVEQARVLAAKASRVMVILDSNHTHAHVRAELDAYAPLVTKGNYAIVFDTLIEDMPPGFFPDRPWDVSDNPKTAVHEFLTTTDRFAIDADVHDKLLITAAPDGYLRCLKD